MSVSADFRGLWTIFESERHKKKVTWRVQADGGGESMAVFIAVLSRRKSPQTASGDMV